MFIFHTTKTAQMDENEQTPEQASEQYTEQTDEQNSNPFETEERISSTNQRDVTCNSCGGHLVFVPGINKLKCESCGAEYEIEAEPTKIEELDFVKYITEKMGSLETQVLHTVQCEGCGAQVTLDENVVSDKCPFCGSILVVTNTLTTTQIKPGSLLPFQLSKVESFDKFKKWVKALWFAPNDLSRKMTDIKDLQGIYVPYWTFDANTDSDYRGERGTYYYVTESYTTTENGRSVTRTRQVRHTRWTSVSGSIHVFFDDVLVVASNSLSKKHVEELEPWDLDNLVPYDEKYLSGFRTETYQTDLQTGFERAKVRIDEGVDKAIRRQIGGDEQRITRKNTAYSDITFKHILLPVYISAYKYKKKVYQVLVNARTGEVQGDRPYSFWKIFFFVLFLIGIFALLFMFSGLFE